MHPVETHTAYIAIGSNLGDRLANCRKGIQALDDHRRSWLQQCSRMYETEPVGYADQEWFINCVIEVRTILSPFALLDRTQTIQRSLGRVGDTIRFGPRILDLDILFYDNVILDSPPLIIPHPRMHERRFVLRPLCDLDASIVHPVLQQEVGYLLSQLPDDGPRVVEIAC
jgi:2-amino-4-hydroxy-6-hydroxymethyldihydropteridine diphosphokinase